MIYQNIIWTDTVIEIVEYRSSNLKYLMGLSTDYQIPMLNQIPMVKPPIPTFTVK